jgi:hypothetical protein
MVVNTAKKKRGSASAALPANGFAEMKDLITQMESFIKEAEALATMEIRRIDEIKESLKASAARLAALFRQKDEILSTRERATKELEDSLAVRIRELEKQLQEKEALLLVRDEMLRSLSAKTSPASGPAKAGFTPPPEGKSSIREMDQGSAERSRPSAREGGSPPEEEQRAGAGEAKGRRFPVHEPETSSGKVDRRETEGTASRLVSLLGPIKRRS